MAEIFLWAVFHELFLGISLGKWELREEEEEDFCLDMPQGILKGAQLLISACYFTVAQHYCQNLLVPLN